MPEYAELHRKPELLTGTELGHHQTEIIQISGHRLPAAGFCEPGDCPTSPIHPGLRAVSSLTSAPSPGPVGTTLSPAILPRPPEGDSYEFHLADTKIRALNRGIFPR